MFIDYDNGEEVLRILNSHDDLVAALKMAKQELLSVLDSIDCARIHHDGDEFHERLEKINAALAKAEGGK